MNRQEVGVGEPSLPRDPGEEENGGKGRAGLVLTIGSAFFVLLLALGSILWPAARQRTQEGTFLVLDPVGDVRRVQEVYRPLAEILEAESGFPLDLEVVGNLRAFRIAAAAGVDFVFCPDGAALALPPDQYAPLVTGRRAAPQNLRPRSVLVYRLAAGLRDSPWLTSPARTVLGDSLSLCGAGPALAGTVPARLECAFGPDPYNHDPALHAARLGSFDYAVVRQWDADRFFASGLMPTTEWGLKPLGDPVPDVLLLASKELGPTQRLNLGQALTEVERSEKAAGNEAELLLRGLSRWHLVGFHVLLEPDWTRVRGQYEGTWARGKNPGTNKIGTR
jgi:hypothetical protein